MKYVLQNKLNILIIFYSFIFSITINQILFLYFSNKITFINFIHTILIFMIFFNSWNIELIHVNRYGQNTIANTIFIFFQILVLVTFLIKNVYELKYLLATLILLAIILAIQHIFVYATTNKANLMIKKLTEPFCYIHTGRTLGLILGLLYIDWAFWFIFLALIVSQLLPSFISRSLHVKDINFSHLVANTHVMIIISVIAIIIGNFLYFGFAIKTLLLDIVVIALLYIFNKKILTVDIGINKQSGNDFILGSYCIIFGIYLVNFSLGYSHLILYVIIAIISLVVGRRKYDLYKIED